MILCLTALLPSCSPQKPSKPPKQIAAHQFRSVMHTSLHNEDMITETQVSSNALLHVRTMTSSKVVVDLITDGEREFLLNDHGQYEEVHGEAAKAFEEWQEKTTLDLAKASGGKAFFVGHEAVNGRMASVYTWTDGESTVAPDKVRVWIADDDFRPLQREDTIQELVPQFSKEPVTQVNLATYGYDSTIKVKLPLP